ncbi:radical SAM protein [Candidatus Peregrinibacteria bacterium]|nr:radical SAM protein [Candidatus Peregrinibacteria bacterium]
MKIKLISPKMSLRPMDSEYKRRLSPSLSLVTLASIIKNDHEVYIEDENTRKVNFSDSPDLVGITANVDTSKRAYEIAKIYKKKEIPTIIGGIHASANPDEALQYADSVCIGEAEELIVLILDDLKKNKLKKIYFNEAPTDPKNIPIPDWSLIDKKNYLYTNIICSSRGCPFKCDFCYNSSRFVHRKYRNRPIPTLIKEVERMDMKQAMFIDDNFIGNPEHAIALVKELKKLNIRWHAAVSTNLVYMPKLMDLMQESGCKSLFIGFESINQDSIKAVNKKQNKIELYEKLIKELHSRGIMVNASLVFGFDSDGPEVFRNTLDWLVKNKIETMTAHILTPYPGTVLYEKMFSNKRIKDTDTRHYNTANVVFRPKNMTEEELKAGYLWIYNQFYSFRNIINRLPEEKSLKLPFLLFNLGYRKFGKFTSILGKLGLMSKIGKLGSKLSYNI